jgi:membrane-bound serine protease (ClpP class)
MAPGTNIGSATPISGSGQELPEDLRRKVVNDAVASIQELARERGRDAEFAKTAITKADNIGAQEALKRGVVDYVASDVRDLLKQSSGSTVQPKNLQLELEKATLDRMEVPWTLRILKPLIDGNLLMLLFGAGVIGLAFEITHPGSVLPGVVGGICLIIALWGLSVLPASGAGIGLLLLAAVLLVLETLAPGGGVFGAGAAVAFVVGALLLFDDSSGYGVSPALALAIGAGMIAFFLLVTRKTIAVRHLPTNTSGDGIAGQRGVVRRVIAPGEPGVVFVDGELWTARAVDSEATLDPGTDINVESVIDMVLIVQSTEPHHVDNDTASEPAEMESE